MDKKKLFKKFLNNQCNSQEAELVSQLLMEEPHLLDELLSEEEWDNYLEEYEQSTVKKGMSWKKVFLLLVIFSFSSILYLNNKQNQHIDMVVSADEDFFFNASDTDVQMTLADGSTVRLHPKSAFYASIDDLNPIRYIELLTGEMYVKVQKNFYKPFVAQTGETQVTALGTEFTLKHDASVDYSYVGLHEGKLKVNVNKTQSEKIILLPGEQVTYSDTQLQLTLNDSLVTQVRKEQAPAPQEVYKRPASITVDGRTIQMNQTKLSEALNFISQELDMPIAYSPKDVEGYHISGSFIVPNANMDINMKEAKASEILSIITKVNPLILQQKHNTNILLNKN